jgi:hypothetical protein
LCFETQRSGTPEPRLGRLRRISGKDGPVLHSSRTRLIFSDGSAPSLRPVGRKMSVSPGVGPSMICIRLLAAVAPQAVPRGVGSAGSRRSEPARGSLLWIGAADVSLSRTGDSRHRTLCDYHSVLVNPHSSLLWLYGEAAVSTGPKPTPGAPPNTAPGAPPAVKGAADAGTPGATGMSEPQGATSTPSGSPGGRAPADMSPGQMLKSSIAHSLTVNS